MSGLSIGGRSAAAGHQSWNHSGYVAHKRDDNTPLSNLYVRMLQEMGIETDAFATSSSVLSWSMP